MRTLKLSEIARAIGGRLVGLDRTTRRISTDTRSLGPGDLFWALTGPNHDGHDFIERAWHGGACGAVVGCQRPAVGDRPASVVQVADPRWALGDLARWYRGLWSIPVLGITGSVGKTSTREMVHGVLAQRYRGIRSRHNYNNDIGLPLTVLDLDETHAYGVFELGVSGPGELRRLAAIARPQLAAITALAPAHLDRLGDLDGVCRAKVELVESLAPDGSAILNGDEPRLRAWAAGHRRRIIWAGCRADCDVRATAVDYQPGRLRFRVNGRDDYTLAVHGRHFLQGGLIAVAVGRLMGLDPAMIARGLASYQPPPMRCRVEDWGSLTVIDDTYNANPASMRAAIELLGETPARRRIAVCGAMLELGRMSRRLHQDLGRWLARRDRIDLVIGIGPALQWTCAAARSEGREAGRTVWVDSAAAAVRYLAATVRTGDVVLVKGSRAVRLESVVEQLRRIGRSEPAGIGPAAPDRRGAMGPSHRDL